LNELVMELLGLGAEGLIGLPMCAEQPRDRR
jgi:hypothetical protein